MSAHDISNTAAGQRLDQFLRGELPEHSRAFLQKLIEQGHIVVNGGAAKASYKVRDGDKIRVEIPPLRPLATQPEEIALNVLFEDDDLIVVNKPAGLVVHPAAGNYEHTLVNALLHHCRGALAGIGGVERPGIVHRLDKGTSGCIVVAKSDFAHKALVAQFKSREVKKTYRAVCWGKFARPSGRIETVIGRTHQIRVHMAHIGHPVVGDVTYGRARSTNISIARPLLHAYKLGFTHPRSQEFVEFTAPVPDDMVKMCES